MSRGDQVVAYLLQRWLYKEQVQDLAFQHDLPTTGTKDELIDRILKKGRINPVEVLAYVTVEGLRDCCEEFGLESDGTRDILVDRISSYVKRSWSISGPRRRPATGDSKQGTDQRAGPPNLTIIHEGESRGYTVVLSIIAVMAEALGVYSYASYGPVGLVAATAVAVLLLFLAYRFYPKSRSPPES